MKYFLRVLFVLVLSVAVVVGVYYYTNDKTLPGQAATHSLTTVSKAPATEKYAQKTLIASLDKYNFSLYKSGRTVILEHDKKEFTFDNWSSVIDAEAPEMTYDDFDGDSDKELLIRAVSGQDEDTKEYVYDMYVLNPVKGDKEDYSVLIISQDTWRTVLNNTVTEELSQLKSCDKFLQFAMDTRSNGINYNTGTGLAQGAAYVAYASALRGDGGYLTFSGWSRSKGIFSLTENNDIDVSVEAIAKYKETSQSQHVGTIHFQLEVTEENKLRIVQKSVYFHPNDEYKVSNPTQTAKKKWNIVRNNSYVPEDSGTIRLMNYGMKIDANVMTDTQNLGGENSDVKYVKSLQINQNGITLRAAKGYTFNKDAASKGDYSVTINRGTEQEYEISYKAKVSDDGSVLKITFDKAYKLNDVKSVDFSYGIR